MARFQLSSVFVMAILAVLLLLAMAVLDAEAARELSSKKCLPLEYACKKAKDCCSGWCDGLCY